MAQISDVYLKILLVVDFTWKNNDWNHKCKCEHFFPNFV